MQLRRFHRCRHFPVQHGQRNFFFRGAPCGGGQLPRTIRECGIAKHPSPKLRPPYRSACASVQPTGKNAPRGPPYIFEPRLFSGVQVGGLKHMRSVNTVGDFALNYSGQFYVGYHLGPYVSLKAAIEYETLNENKYGELCGGFSWAWRNNSPHYGNTATTC